MEWSFLVNIGIILAVLVIVSVVSVRTGKLTVPAALTGVVMGGLVFAGAGYPGIILLGAFFIMGTLATAHKKQLKAKLHPGGFHPQARNTGQVLANGGMAVLLSALSLADNANAPTYLMMLAASLASATSDTLSSELGMVYGRNTWNILTFKREPRGLDGVISLEGTLLGVAGAAVIAGLYALGAGFDKSSLFVLLAGVFGNLADSVLGASLERGRYIGNDAVNFLNTLLAALAAWGLLMLFPIHPPV